jgi:hypothetical protein
MLRTLRSFLSVVIALAGVVLVRSQGASTATPPPPAIPANDVDALIQPTQTWSHIGSLRTSLGWRDNVLLSAFAPINRPFARQEVEVLARGTWRQYELISFLNGDVLRYFSPPRETGGEQQWSGELEGRWQPENYLRFGLKAVGYLQDTVLDLSEAATTRVVVPARVRGGYATALTRLGLPLGFSLEPSVQVKRTDYRDFPGDYDEIKPGARLTWSRSPWFGLSAAWYAHRRDYAQRNQYTAGGRALTGTRLHFRQREAEVKATSAWDRGGHWSVALATAWLANRDEGSGFFDYDQKRVRLDAEWERGPWRSSFSGEAKRMDYRVQTVGAGLAPPPRVADGFDLTARVERDLTAVWSVFMEYHWERNRSNEGEFEYRMNTALAGVQRSF